MDPRERSLLTIVPTLEGAQRIADAARRGEISDEVWIDCVIPSTVDDTLCPPGKAMMTCFIQYLPYRTRPTAHGMSGATNWPIPSSARSPATCRTCRS